VCFEFVVDKIVGFGFVGELCDEEGSSFGPEGDDSFVSAREEFTLCNNGAQCNVGVR
jgi:hypothetical protein